MRKILLALMLIPSLAFAVTDETQYVDWSTGCGSNDGTVGNPYCSCTEWEGQNRNLVTEDKNLTVQFIGTGTGSVNCALAGWTTDATRKIRITGLKMVDSTTGSALFTNSVANVTLEDGILGKNVASTDIKILDTGNVAMTVQRMKIYCGSSCTRSSSFEGIYFYEGGTFRNNMVYGLVQGNMQIPLDDTSGTVVTVVANNTFYNNAGTVNFSRGSGGSNGILRFDNNIATSCGGSCYTMPGGSVSVTSATNISSDTSSPDVAFRSKTITYVDAANGDLHLDPGETDAIDMGTDRSAWGYSDDYDAATRTGTWDIGADEITATTNYLAVLNAMGEL